MSSRFHTVMNVGSSIFVKPYLDQLDVMMSSETQATYNVGVENTLRSTFNSSRQNVFFTVDVAEERFRFRH
jgi:hypothetical protein